MIFSFKKAEDEDLGSQSLKKIYFSLIFFSYNFSLIFLIEVEIIIDKEEYKDSSIVIDVHIIFFVLVILKYSLQLYKKNLENGEFLGLLHHFLEFLFKMKCNCVWIWIWIDEDIRKKKKRLMMIGFLGLLCHFLDFFLR